LPKYSWVILLREKSEAFQHAKVIFKKLQNGKGYYIKRIRSDHVKEFKNASFADFCEENNSKQEFLAPITPQQNEVVERKSQVMNCKNLATYFWEAVKIACHIINRVYLRSQTEKTTCEWWKEKKPTVK
jgi:transposase InsO family protein